MEKHSSSGAQFQRSLRLIDGVMLVSGVMIGSGIFIVSAEIARTVGGVGYLLLVWVLSGVMTIIGALSYGELSGMFPHAGGQYVYLREALHPLIGFLYGWAFFLVIETGTIAAVAVAFAKYTAYLLPQVGEDYIIWQIGGFAVNRAQLLAIAMILFLTYVNTRGIRTGKWIQLIFTLAKILALLLLVILGLWIGFQAQVWQANWQQAWHAFQVVFQNGQTIQQPSSGILLIGLTGVAMVGALFSSDAWNSVTFIAAEIKKPEKNIGRSMFLGTLLVTIVYLLCNVMYVGVLSMHEIATAPADRVASAAAVHFLGTWGAGMIAAMIMISTFGCNNGLVLSGARVYYTMANDRLFFSPAGKLNEKGVPATALWLQGIWASLLCISGKYSDLLNYVIFVVLIFYVLTIVGIIRLRKTRPDLHRPYRAVGYPYLPVLYIAMAICICISLLWLRPDYTWPGLIIVLIGIPMYYAFIRRQKSSSVSSQS
ncbi:APC family permease [Thermoflavifilum thermophilum]|uniref:Amino acid/polyamine/organocation transporter, APC superfamily (TC 2.A.3) n=1 Tax=Thermoflavifilum thermophilum TaxID=1393122 RepID=A0A1I7NJC6_9BACT|nr:amino acid permease [Thermoflavifilum thermophilum]SFV34676.1 amino acid/polyamine/organocation transporter, APC superfamily (TC 2.A.3) [Thermoflavifilum thermophilum]